MKRYPTLSMVVFASHKSSYDYKEGDRKIALVYYNAFGEVAYAKDSSRGKTGRLQRLQLTLVGGKRVERDRFAQDFCAGAGSRFGDGISVPA